MPKATITQRARHRPKSRLDQTMIAKLLSFLHSKLGKLAQQGALVAGTWLAAKGKLDSETTLAVTGAIAVLLGALLDWIVFQLSTKFVKERQSAAGVTVDGYAGPETRAAAKAGR